MALSLKDGETDRLARAVADMTGESLTQAVKTSLAERLTRERLRRGIDDPSLIADLIAIVSRSDHLPVLDDRSADEIIGYDENGVPS